MPYIKQSDREIIGQVTIDQFTPSNAGDLQYVIARMIHNYHVEHGLNYQMANNIMGALAGAQQEYYAAVVSPYEQRKLQDNGAVYFPDGYENPLTINRY